MFKNAEEYIDYLIKDDNWAFVTEWENSFSTARKDIIAVMDIKPGAKILDVGCSCGETLEYIKNNYPDVDLYGVEPQKEAADKASKFGSIFTGTIEQFLKVNKNKFDAVIMADVIEHLQEPWIDVRDTAKHIKDDGALYASIPNFFHYTVMYNLFECGSFAYQSNDIINRGHIRYFTLEDCSRLFTMAGLGHTKVYGNKVQVSEKLKETSQKLQAIFNKDYSFDIYQFVTKSWR